MNALVAEIVLPEQEALIAPHGGTLRDLYLPTAEAEALKRQSASLPQWTLNQRQLCDLELLLNGGFSPLQGFLGRSDYDSVVSDMRLADGTLWPIPVVLDVDEAFAARLPEHAQISLNDTQGTPLAVLTVEDVYFPDHIAEARQVLGTTDRTHPGVAELLDRTGSVYLGGRVRGIQPPAHYDFAALRHSPREHQARRCGSLHARALLSRVAGALPAG